MEDLLYFITELIGMIIWGVDEGQIKVKHKKEIDYEKAHN